MVAATLAAVPPAGVTRHTLRTAGRAVPPAVILVAAPATTLVVAMARSGPRAGAPRRATPETPFGPAGVRAIALPTAAATPPRGEIERAVAVVEPVPVATVVEVGTALVAAGVATPEAVPTIPAPIVAAAQRLEAVTRTEVAPVRQAVPNGQRDVPVAGPSVPPTLAPRNVGVSEAVLEQLLAGRGERPLPITAGAVGQIAPAPATAPPRLVGAAVILGAMEVEPPTVPRPQATGGVPLRRPVAVGVATSPAARAPTRVRAGPPGAPRPGTVLPPAMVPVVVVATAAATIPATAPSAVSRRTTHAVEPEAHPGAL